MWGEAYKATVFSRGRGLAWLWGTDISPLALDCRGVYHDMESVTTGPVYPLPTLDTAVFSLALTRSAVYEVTGSSTAVIFTHGSLSMLRYSPCPFDGGMVDTRLRSGTAFTALPRYCCVFTLILGTVRYRDLALTVEWSVWYCCAPLPSLDTDVLSPTVGPGSLLRGFSRLTVG